MESFFGVVQRLPWKRTAMRMRQTFIVGLASLLLSLCSRPVTGQPYFTGIGTLDGYGTSVASGVSASSTVVLGTSGVDAPHPKEAVYWTMEDGMVSLTPGRHSDTSGGANGTGSVLTGVLVSWGTTEGFRWTHAEGAVGLGDLPGGEFRSSAGGTSADGKIVVGSSSSENSSEDYWEAFWWTAETGLVPMGDLPGGIFRSGATAISADGFVIVGNGRTELGPEAFRWVTGKGMVGLGDLPGSSFDSTAVDVSADGSVVIGWSKATGGTQGFRWTAETGMVGLGRLAEEELANRAYGTSWDGNVIVGEAFGLTGEAGPYYWTPEHGMRWLTDVFDEHGVVVPDGWSLSRAYAVSADGRTIVGYGVNPQGNTEGWVAYLGPGCRADFDDDGTVDPEDVAAYITAWLNRNIFTDWNYDGSINTRDLLGFLNEWNTQPGCE